MTSHIRTEHPNELILVEAVLDSGGGALVALGLINEDGSNTFPGRTLTADQAEELAARLARSAAAARATAGLGRAPSAGEEALAETLSAIRTAVPLSGATADLSDDQDGQPETQGGAPEEATVAVEEPQPDQPGEPEELPINEYDGLSASAVNKLLSGLSAAQLATVLAYEQGHRNRKTVCERIASLQSAAARATSD